jgi:hypothetical protein
MTFVSIENTRILGTNNVSRYPKYEIITTYEILNNIVRHETIASTTMTFAVSTAKYAFLLSETIQQQLYACRIRDRTSVCITLT